MSRQFSSVENVKAYNAVKEPILDHIHKELFANKSRKSDVVIKVTQIPEHILWFMDPFGEFGGFKSNAFLLEWRKISQAYTTIFKRLLDLCKILE